MTQALKFLGRGSAFNTIEGNTSAYFIKENTFFLIDCGELIFATLAENNKLLNLVNKHNIENIEIYITHLHSDHVGSLSSLIYYCYYVLKITPKIYHPQRIRVENNTEYLLNQLLQIQGHTIEYEYKKNPCSGIYASQCLHDTNLKSYSYMFINLIANKRIFYSGDCRELLASDTININNKYFDEVYLECSLHKNPVHMSIDYLDEIISKDKTVRDRIFLMHIDNPDIFNKAKELGFKVVELNG